LPILAYLDDDAIASHQWLQILLNAYENNEKLAVAGGKVTLIWPQGYSQPNWLSDELAGGLGAFDLGDNVVYISQANLTPRGVNYSIRRDFWEEIGGFDPNLGRIGKKLLSNEELYTTELALARGWQVGYFPQALVEHNVAWKESIVNGLCVAVGGKASANTIGKKWQEETGLGQFGRGGERLARGLVKYVKFINDPAKSFDNLLYAYGQIGYLSEAAKAMLTPQK
jgi:hypothetical protein